MSDKPHAIAPPRRLAVSAEPGPRPLEISPSLFELQISDHDWEKESATELCWMAQWMILIREFEEALLALKDQGLVYGPVHTSIGQEAVAAGAAAALRSQDKISGTHRAHHQFLAKALAACREPAQDAVVHGLTAEMNRRLQMLLAEVMGLAEGCCGGRGGSMHLFYPEAGIVGTNAIVAGGVPHATGVAWADRYFGREDVTVCFFGDGALYQGVLHESCNLAGLTRAPVIYCVENNQYAVSTPTSESCSAPRLYQVALAYGMRGLRVDGMNPLAVKRAMEYVVAQRDDGWLPCFIEAQTYRYFHHAGKIPGSAFGYRSKDEESKWQHGDPLEACSRQLRRLGVLDEAGEQKLRDNAKASIEAAIRHCTETAGDKTIVRESAWPAPASLAAGLRQVPCWSDLAIVEAEQVERTREISYSDAIAEVTGRWLEKDPTVVVLGEDIATLGGGPYGATKGLSQRFPGRVINTPITEAGFCGLACGAALNGMHPIVEIMFSSFVLVAADQLLNQIGQLAHIYGGKTTLPLVVRTRVALGLGYGAQHSLDPVAIFSLFPGWQIFVPTTPFDYIGLFNAAMSSRTPTLIVEHHSFYPTKGKIPAGPLDHVVRPGLAKILRPGKDATVVTCGAGVTAALEASRRAAVDGYEAEVLELRSLDDAGIDYDTVGRSLEKTGILIVVEEAPSANSIGGKIIAGCISRFFYSLEGAPVAVAAPDVPIPVSKRLESLCLMDIDRIAETIRLAALRRL